MRKNFSENFATVEVDPVTGEYILVFPEWLVNDMGWYEGTVLEWNVEGDEIILRESKDD
tara:strand:+ start:1546 stop:1722 length:177 start_codon:yes stop_codon:yes gene_type:complete